MTLQLEYSENFDTAWDELKEKVRKQIDAENCIDDENNIKWPCYVYIVKQEKKQWGNY